MQVEKAHDVFRGLLVGIDALGRREYDAVRGDAEVARALLDVHDVGEPAAGEEGDVKLGIHGGNGFAHRAHADVPRTAGGRCRGLEFGKVLGEGGSGTHGEGKGKGYGLEEMLAGHDLCLLGQFDVQKLCRVLIEELG